MIKNQRPYQYAYSKTHSNLISLFVGCAAKTAGILALEGSAFLKKECVKGNEKVARAALEKIFEKPQSDFSAKPLLPTDERIDLSVIIPVYNAQNYIDACMESILKQKTGYSVEIIAVNDSSTDATAEKLDKYRTFPNVKIIDLKDGGSAAKARNEGLLHASGENVMFVDSDDLLPQSAIDILMRKMDKSSADIIQGSWQYIDERGEKGLFQKYAEKEYTGRAALERFDLPGMPWGKIYKRKLFEDIRFPSYYTCFEDAVIHFFVFGKAAKTVSVGDNVYYWRKHRDSLTRKSQNSAKALQSLWIAEEMIEKDTVRAQSCDEMFAMCVIGQLSNFCYANVAQLDSETKKNIFILCCDLYKKALPNFNPRKLPYAMRVGAKALRKNRFDLWTKQGKFYQLIR